MASTTTPLSACPTGDQWLIGHGRQAVVITEVGATLRSYTVGGEHVIDGFGSDEWSQGGRGQVLAPWPNRLGDGRYTFRGREAQLALNEPERGNAIHGLVRWLPWRLEAKAQNMVVVSCVLYPTPGYPYTLLLRIQYHLGREGLTITTTACNLGTDTLPFGIGFHPYFTVGTPSIDTVTMRMDARSRLLTDDRGLPTGELRSVAGTEYDFAEARQLGPIRLDTGYSGLQRGGEGRAAIELSDPARGRCLSVWMGDQFDYVMCFTGDTLSPGQRRRGLAIEPMTCPPDAFRSRTGVTELEPGVSWIGVWGISPGS